VEPTGSTSLPFSFRLRPQHHGGNGDLHLYLLALLHILPSLCFNIYGADASGSTPVTAIKFDDDVTSLHGEVTTTTTTTTTVQRTRPAHGARVLCFG